MFEFVDRRIVSSLPRAPPHDLGGANALPREPQGSIPARRIVRNGDFMPVRHARSCSRLHARSRRNSSVRVRALPPSAPPIGESRRGDVVSSLDHLCRDRTRRKKVPYQPWGGFGRPLFSRRGGRELFFDSPYWANRPTGFSPVFVPSTGAVHCQDDPPAINTGHRNRRPHGAK